jgi:hypothetical protein
VQTECKERQLEFQGFGRRQVVASFDGGRISSDGGLLLLREVASRSGLLARFGQCFTDCRDARYIEHTVEELVSQRVLGLAQGYEDLNDHDTLRDDLLFGLAVGKADVTGAQRRRERDRGHALAGKSTLNRLERTPEKLEPTERYTKIVYDAARIEQLFTDDFIRAQATPPEEVVLDLMPPMIRCMASRRGGFSTAITAVIVICRCTFSVVTICCAPSYARPIRMAPPAPSMR